MAGISERERVAHVVRRLSMGAHPDLLPTLADTATAVDRCLDLSAPTPEVPLPPVPTDRMDARKPRLIAPLVAWWIERMAAPSRLVEERLVWFWHDHFATGLQKVRSPYLMARQHATIRAHASGNFRALLHAVAKDPAMLVYLDGVTNRAGAVNENFGRECLELFTLGRDAGYTQDDVVAMARACTGWVLDVPGRPRAARGATSGAPFDASLAPRRHDAASKTLLGRVGRFDMDSALDVVLAHPACARHVAGKLYRELVGAEPDDATAARLGDAFGRDFEILPLVRAIAAEPAFTADRAVRATVRSPVERRVALLQAARAPGRPAAYLPALRTLGYVPFLPPNVGGFPKGDRLLGPHQLLHGLDLLDGVPGAAAQEAGRDPDLLASRFGIFDATSTTRRTIAAERDPHRRFVLAFAAPEAVLS
jgi:uncharacterized protein (DUF1800 family)